MIFGRGRLGCNTTNSCQMKGIAGTEERQGFCRFSALSPKAYWEPHKPKVLRPRGPVDGFPHTLREPHGMLNRVNTARLLPAPDAPIRTVVLLQHGVLPA